MPKYKLAFCNIGLCRWDLESQYLNSSKGRDCHERMNGLASIFNREYTESAGERTKVFQSSGDFCLSASGYYRAGINITSDAIPLVIEPAASDADKG